ncbi:cell division control protein 6 homolog B-like [Herrania umbratica]|uniref:Cell division control protein n=1 Tax=Herrania umbratica TaxID=108875 RepID=A0A6J0ZW75_9ROSI|nr:cell division control protein 6 homolog B-like [Herrania umbratica]
MPAIADRNSSPFKEIVAVIKSDKSGDMAGSNGCCTPQKRRLRSDAAAARESPVSTPMKLKSPRRRLNSSPNSPANGIEEDFSEKPVKKNWNPRDVEHMRAVKEALHVSTAPSTIVCREDEQKRVLEFCKACVEQEKAGSLYVCGCPGTGKSLSMEKVKQQVIDWATTREDLLPLEVLALSCTSLANTSEIFSKILGKHRPKKKTMGSTSPLQHLQKLYSNKQARSGSKMMLIIADELDYLITKDRAVLHDLFMLTTFPFSRCILIGIANSIDLADRFLPRLQSLNCKPMVVTFRAYSKDQILSILQERLLVLPYIVFEQQALELCARKVAAASGDMRKALCVCRSAMEILEAELRESASNLSLASVEGEFISQQTAPALEIFQSEENNTVRIDHMALALSKTFRSPIVDTIQSLPQHQQIILCSAVKFFRGGKKDSTVGELNKSYIDICKSAMIPPVGILEFSSMCRVLNDQGLFKLGQSRDDKSKRVTLKVDEADISFALQGVRFFRNCLQ